jgi:hypothetical protein
MQWLQAKLVGKQGLEWCCALVESVKSDVAARGSSMEPCAAAVDCMPNSKADALLVDSDCWQWRRNVLHQQLHPVPTYADTCTVRCAAP